MNPILFTLGGVEVRWYSALMLTGMLITIIMVKKGEFIMSYARWATKEEIMEHTTRITRKDIHEIKSDVW